MTKLEAMAARVRARGSAMGQAAMGQAVACQAAIGQCIDAGYELRFDSLFDEGRALSFPCDALGHVDLDRLSDRARNNYLYARAVIGREFRAPAVRLV